MGHYFDSNTRPTPFREMTESLILMFPKIKTKPAIIGPLRWDYTNGHSAWIVRKISGITFPE